MTTTIQKNDTTNKGISPNKKALLVTRTTVVLADTDAAGCWFFSRWIEMAHKIFEQWLEKEGLPLRKILQMPVIIPVVRCEALFEKPAKLGDKLKCALCVVEVKKKSFSWECLAWREDVLLARCRATHVAVDRKTNQAVELPDAIVKLINKANTSAK